MCGFVAIFSPEKRGLPDLQTLKKMTDVMEARGPDYAGYFEDPYVSFSHRRLSIIDLTEQANQPMEKDHRTIVFNGEIYNFLEIRRELEASFGSVFKTGSDTEVIVESYRCWGADCVKKFNGMFAFVIWDAEKKNLFVARDRLGVKPLFMAKEGGCYFFASDIKALWEYFPPKIGLDSGALRQFFSQGYIQGKNSSTKGIEKFPSAHSLTLHGEGEVWKSYWDLNDVPKDDMDFDEAVEETELLLKNAVRIRLRSDVPVGCFLSGGVDSSLVTALTVEEGLKGFHTYSIGFDDPRFDESRYSDLVAKKYGTVHEHIRLQASSLSSLPSIVWHSSEPFGDSSAVPSYFVSQAARKGLKVVLTGDGADEGFGGYLDPFAVYLNDKYKQFVPAWMRNVLSPLGQFSDRFRKFNELSHLTPESFQQVFNTSGWPGFSDGFYADVIRACRREGKVDKLLYADIMDRLEHDFLVKVDKATMAHSIEARSPFLDYRLMELGYSLNSSTRFHRFTRKAVLKKIAEKYLDRENIYRRKMGFTMPLAAWLLDPLWKEAVKKIIARPSVLSHFISDSSRTKIVGEFFAGKKEHATRIWLLLWFQIWEGLFLSRVYQKSQTLSELVL